MAQEEKHIQKEILNYLEAKGIFHYRQNSGGIARGGRYYKFCSINGVSDIIAIINGIYYGIEVKNEKGKQSKDQKIFEESLKNAGGIYILARSLKDVINHLNKNE